MKYEWNELVEGGDSITIYGKSEPETPIRGRTKMEKWDSYS